MAKSSIEWTDESWNPVVGCTRASRGCDNCYAVRMSHRLENMGQSKYSGLTVVNGRGDRHFNGQVRCVEEDLLVPLRWKKPRRCFVNSMSDLFHRDVPFDFIDKVFAVVALCPQHTFQILTKRPDRMAEYFANLGYRETQIGTDASAISGLDQFIWEEPIENTRPRWPLPLPNVWLGTSCEDQAAADERIPHLRRSPAAVRFLSCEPLLGPISLYLDGIRSQCQGLIHWVIAGGESGPGAHPMHPDWARSLRDQCQAAGVPFFFKQWGEFVTESEAPDDIVLPGSGTCFWAGKDGDGDQTCCYRVGKHRAGRLLDGRTWDEYPGVANA